MKNSKELYKYCFMYWKNSNYDKKVLSILSDKFNVGRERIREYIKRYINGNEEFSDIERQRLYSFIAVRDITLTLYNRLNISLEGTSREERQKVINKYCYDYCRSVNWDNSRMDSIERLLGLTSRKIKEYAKQHMIDNGISLEEMYITVEKVKKQKLQNIGPNITRNIVLENISKEDSFEKIKDIIEQSGIDASYLKYSVSDYVTVYRTSLKDTLIDELKAKIDRYIAYKNKEKREKILKHKEEKMKKQELEEADMLVVAREVIIDFIDSESNLIDYYVKSKHMTLKVFKNYVNLVKKYDLDLYQRYYIKINNIRIKSYIYMINTVKTICFLLINNVEENGDKRPFDLLDYYSMTKLSLTELMEFVNVNRNKIGINNDEYARLNRFVKKNNAYKEYSSTRINSFINSVIKVEINNEEEKYVKTFTKEELEAMINYLIINSIPINEKTLYLIRCRYINGSIDLFSNKSKKRIRSN